MPVFPDANNFTIAGSSFTEVHGNSVHNSSNIVYNVYFTPRIDAQSQPMDNEKWKELVSNIEHVITKRQDGKSPDEVEDNTRSVIHIHSTLLLLNIRHLNVATILIPTRRNQ